jgi:hypothetical protein
MKSEYHTCRNVPCGSYYISYETQYIVSSSSHSLSSKVGQICSYTHSTGTIVLPLDNLRASLFRLICHEPLQSLARWVLRQNLMIESLFESEVEVSYPAVSLQALNHIHRLNISILSSALLDFFLSGRHLLSISDSGSA